MDLTNDFRVAIPIERAWEVLTDLERIAPCMPGAQLQEVEGDIYRGVVKVKVGPVQAQYKGEVTFIEQDAQAYVAVLRAEGRETRGQGNAAATITANLSPDGDGTAVTITTDLTITGRVAQFGRGVLADVSAGLLDQFVETLESTVLAEESPEAARAEAGDTETGVGATDGAEATDVAETPEPTGAVEANTTVRKIDSPEPEPVDLMATAGSPVIKRILPAVIALVVGFVVVQIIAKRRSRRRSKCRD